jgi:hypothetical protein
MAMMLLSEGSTMFLKPRQILLAYYGKSIRSSTTFKTVNYLFAASFFFFRIFIVGGRTLV